MKSAVVTTAISSVSRYTPASSLVSNPTSRFGSSIRGRSARSLPSPTGSILAAQPQVLERPVRVAFLNGLNSDMDNFLKLECSFAILVLRTRSEAIGSAFQPEAEKFEARNIRISDLRQPQRFMPSELNSTPGPPGLDLYLKIYVRSASDTSPGRRAQASSVCRRRGVLTCSSDLCNFAGIVGQGRTGAGIQHPARRKP